MLPDPGGLASENHPSCLAHSSRFPEAWAKRCQSWLNSGTCWPGRSLRGGASLAPAPPARPSPTRPPLPHPRSPAGESLWRGSRCQIRKCRWWPRNVPQRRASALPVATCFPNFAPYTQDTNRWSALGQSGAHAGGKSRNQGPQLQEVLSLGRVFFFLNFIWGKKRLQKSYKNDAKISHIPLTQIQHLLKFCPIYALSLYFKIKEYINMYFFPRSEGTWQPSCPCYP